MRIGKCFAPEAIVPAKERDDCMKKVFKVEDLNRMNDVFAKYIFANEGRKKLTLGLINSFFDFEGTAEIIDLAFKDREMDPDRQEGKGVELPKWHYKKGAKMKRLERWLAYLSSKTTMEEREALAMVDEDIRTAMEAEKEFVQDYEYISAYDRQEKYLRDQEAREAFVREEGETIGFAKGEASGLAKGKAEAKKELIIAWRNKGKTDSEIAELLDMDEDEVKQIK